VLSSIYFDRASHDGGNRIYTSTYTNSASGVLNSVYINDGRPRTVTYINNLDGHVLRRREQDSTSSGDPLEIWYRFNGAEMSFVGNNNTTELDYETSILMRKKPPSSTTTPTPFRYGATTSTSYADTDRSFDAVNSFKQGSASGGGYTVKGGESLAGIAQCHSGASVLHVRGLRPLPRKQADASRGVSGERVYPDPAPLTPR